MFSGVRKQSSTNSNASPKTDLTIEGFNKIKSLDFACVSTSF